ncbi:MAG: metallophosphoesterase [Isosphaeraceae bacterium]|nr:metallophosphoesterase [Isosphaeraceae bacterium]
MSVRLRRRLLVVAVVGLASFGVAAALLVRGWAGARRNSDEWFVVKPYLQLGDAPASPSAPTASLELLWQGYDRDESWSVEVQGALGKAWSKAAAPTVRRVAVWGIKPRRLYRTSLRDLALGAEHAYRVRLGTKVVFEASARAPRPLGASHRFVAFGDGGAGTPGQRAVAFQIGRARPDLLLITGDIAYMKGRLTDYDEKFFPVYNNDDDLPSQGAPLMRSIPFFATPGNHDMVYRNLDDVPDALAYFLIWAQPLNGPMPDLTSKHWPVAVGAEDRVQAFRKAAGAAYPRMANFSFDYGDAHWTVLDANTYVDFGAPELREWLARDLAAAQGAAWRFVAFHHPPFHSSKAHADDQRTRLLVELLEQGRVDLVFTGHVHNYQRTYPLRFVAEKGVVPGGNVAGRWELDREFDGVTRTQPKGVIYLVTGAGGARLYDTDLHDDASSRLEFTTRFVSNTHSFTVADVEPKRVMVRQVSDQGQELDRFVVTK